MSKSFTALVGTAFLGAANDNFFKNALVMLIAFKGMQVWGLDHKSVIALAGGIFILPYFLFSGLAGEISDKLDRALVVRYTKYGELLIMMGASICFFMEAYDWLLLVLFCMGTQSTFFSPAKYSAIKDLSRKENFVKANAYMEMATFLAILLGTIGGGLAASTNSYGLISLFILGMALVGIVSSRSIDKVAPLSPDLKLSLDPLTPSIKIIKDSFSNRDVLWTILTTSWFWFLGASLLALMPVLAKDVLSANETVATAFLACFTIGIGLGSFLCEKLSAGKVELGLSILGSIIASLFMIDIPTAVGLIAIEPGSNLSLHDFLLIPGSIRLFIDLVFVSLFMGLFVVPLNSWLQLACRPSLRSRVIACNNIVNAVAMVLSAVFIMLLHQLQIPTTDMFMILGFVGLGITGLVAIGYPRLFYAFKFWRKHGALSKIEIDISEEELRAASQLFVRVKDDSQLASLLALLDPNINIQSEKVYSDSTDLGKIIISFMPAYSKVSIPESDQSYEQTLYVYESKKFKTEILGENNKTSSRALEVLFTNSGASVTTSSL